MKKFILGYFVIFLLLSACTTQQSVSTPKTSTTTPISTTTSPFSGIATFDILESSATIQWFSENFSHVKIEYGQTSDYGFVIDPEYDYPGGGSVTLQKLLPKTTYHFCISVIEQNGEPIVTKDYTFLTLTPKGEYSVRFFPFENSNENSLSSIDYSLVGTLNTNLFNNSSDTITINKIEFLYDSGEVFFVLPASPLSSENSYYSFTEGRSDLPESWTKISLASGDSLFTGIDLDLLSSFKEIEGWTVIWYLTDKYGHAIRAIADVSPMP